jgi:hypothetical protein
MSPRLGSGASPHKEKPLGETFPPAVAALHSTVKIGDLAIVQTEHQATVLGQSDTANHRHQILASIIKASDPSHRPDPTSSNSPWPTRYGINYQPAADRRHQVLAGS